MIKYGNKEQVKDEQNKKHQKSYTNKTGAEVSFPLKSHALKAMMIYLNCTVSSKIPLVDWSQMACYHNKS